MAQPSYSNPITIRDVSLAIETFLIAPFPTAWTPGRVSDIASPPAGFKWLGAVDEESPAMTITRNRFQLRTGIPQVLQYQAVTGLEARVTFTLHTRDTRKILYALGNSTGDASLYVAPNSLTLVTAVGSAGQITLAASPANGWYLGDEIVTSATSAGWATSQNFAVISSINGLVVTFTPAFGSTPVVTPGVAAKPVAHRIGLGKAITNNYRILGVADFIDRYQLIHDIQKCQPAGEWSEQLRASQNERVTLAFDAFGLPDTANYGGELIVGERYLFQPE